MGRKVIILVDNNIDTLMDSSHMQGRRTDWCIVKLKKTELNTGYTTIYIYKTRGWIFNQTYPFEETRTKGTFLKLEQAVDHLEQNELLTWSCKIQLPSTCQDFVDNRGQSNAILLDFSKAFDKVRHQSLGLILRLNQCQKDYDVINGLNVSLETRYRNKYSKVTNRG